MTLPIIVSPEADEQIHGIDAWWRKNRQASADLFYEELKEALEHIRSAPEAGHRYRHRTRKGVRRVPLQVTLHHVYYEVVTTRSRFSPSGVPSRNVDPNWPHRDSLGRRRDS